MSSPLVNILCWTWSIFNIWEWQHVFRSNVLMLFLLLRFDGWNVMLSPLTQCQTLMATLTDLGTGYVTYFIPYFKSMNIGSRHKWFSVIQLSWISWIRYAVFGSPNEFVMSLCLDSLQFFFNLALLVAAFCCMIYHKSKLLQLITSFCMHYYELN